MLVLLVISLSFPRPFRDHYVRHRMVLLSFFYSVSFVSFVSLSKFAYFYFLNLIGIFTLLLPTFYLIITCYRFLILVFFMLLF